VQAGSDAGLRATQLALGGPFSCRARYGPCPLYYNSRRKSYLFLCISIDTADQLATDTPACYPAEWSVAVKILCTSDLRSD
jgi:hypothetical protein